MCLNPSPDNSPDGAARKGNPDAVHKPGTAGSLRLRAVCTVYAQHIHRPHRQGQPAPDGDSEYEDGANDSKLWSFPSDPSARGMESNRLSTQRHSVGSSRHGGRVPKKELTTKLVCRCHFPTGHRGLLKSARVQLGVASERPECVVTALGGVHALPIARQFICLPMKEQAIERALSSCGGCWHLFPETTAFATCCCSPGGLVL
jgi:hypothetical protein